MHFLLLHSLERHAGHLGDDVHHVIGRDDDLFFFALLAPFRQNCIELFLGLLFPVAKGGRFFKILRFDSRFLFQPDPFDLFLDFLHIRRPRHRIDACPCARFIHHVDGFIGEKTAGDISL